MSEKEIQKRRGPNSGDIEDLKALVPAENEVSEKADTGGISAMGLKVLILLAVQNSSKNLLMRWVMKEKPKFLTSAAVIGSECTKLSLSLF